MNKEHRAIINTFFKKANTEELENYITVTGTHSRPLAIHDLEDFLTAGLEFVNMTNVSSSFLGGEQVSLCLFKKTISGYHNE